MAHRNQKRLPTKSEGLFRRIMTSFFLLLTFVTVLGNPTSSIQGVESAPAPAPAPPMYCSIDESCEVNMYCRAENGVCSPCTDCGKQSRIQGSQKCAKTTSDCGPCKENFEDVGGHCVEKETSHEEPVQDEDNFTISTEETNNWKKVSTDDNDSDSRGPWMIYVIIGIVIIILAALGFGVTHKYYKLGSGFRNRPAHNGGSGSGANERLWSRESNHETTVDILSEPSPSAPPPEEYSRPGPFVPSPTTIEMPQIYNPCAERTRLMGASPFQAGNGAGDWNTPDEKDGGGGAAAAPEPMQQEAEVQGHAPDVPPLVPNNAERDNEDIPEDEADDLAFEEMDPDEIDGAIGGEPMDVDDIPLIDEEGMFNTNQVPRSSSPDYRRRHGSDAFDPSATCIDLSDMLNRSSSASNVSSSNISVLTHGVSNFSYDSGTGTGTEDDANNGNNTFYNQVPDNNVNELNEMDVNVNEESEDEE